MSKRGISKKQTLEIIAYIDGSLSGKQKEAFEVKLSNSAELSQEVRNQKRVKAALRALPFKKAPRSFVLSPDMVSIRKPKLRLAPAFSLASAAVTILLIAVFAGEYILGNTAQTAMMESAALEMAAYDEAAPVEPMLIFWNAESSGKGGGGGEAFGIGGGALEPGMESAILVPETREEPVAEEMTVGADPSLSKGVVEEQDTVIFGLDLEEDDLDQSTVLRQTNLLRLIRSVSIVQWVKIGLGTLALGFGITAIVYWIKRRH